MKKHTILLILLLSTLFVTATWKVLQKNRVYEQNLEHLNNDLETARGWMRGLTESQSAYIGRTLVWTELEAIEDQTVDHPAREAKYRIVLYFDEVDCNVCLDKETQFLKSVAETFGAEHTAFVLRAQSPRYIVNYIRVNALDQGVLYDPEGGFAKANGIAKSPMLFVINAENLILASFSPARPYPEISEIFHEACFDLLSQNPEI